MPSTPSFHSALETDKRPTNRVYHNNSACAPGRDIPQHQRRSGTGGYRLCTECDLLNRLAQ
jgi:hypothetical protein